MKVFWFFFSKKNILSCLLTQTRKCACTIFFRPRIGGNVAPAQAVGLRTQRTKDISCDEDRFCSCPDPWCRRGSAGGGRRDRRCADAHDRLPLHVVGRVQGLSLLMARGPGDP